MTDPRRRIDSLDPEIRGKVDRALARGTSAEKVAKMVQSLGYYAEVKLPTLKKQLQRYKLTNIQIPIAAREKAIARAEKPDVQRRLLAKADRMDLVAEHVRLYEIQKKRLERYLELEKNSKLPMPGTALEVKAQKELLESLERFMFEAGLLTRAPKAFHGFIGVPSDEAQAAFVEKSAEWEKEKFQRLKKALSVLDGEFEDVPALEHKPEDDESAYVLVEHED